MRTKTTIALLFILISGVASAKTQKNQQLMQTFSIKTGSTRIIYTPGSVGVSLLVLNPQSYPMLVQSIVLKDDRQEKAPFIVTPPLFRLDGKQQNKIKVVAVGDTGPADRESLDWLCLTGIPPEADSAWAGDNISPSPKHATILTQLRVKSCIKILVRPPSLKGKPVDMTEFLTWHKSGSTLTVDNPTPFYMNLRTVHLGYSTINSPGYVPPYGQLHIVVHHNDNGLVHWKLVTDYGGDSREFESPLG